MRIFGPSLVLAAFALACSRGGGKDPVSPAKPGTGDEVTAPVPGAPADWSPIALLPADTGLAVFVSLEGLRKAPAWRQVEPRLTSLAPGGVDRIRTQCGFDPIQDSTWFMVATDRAFDERSTFALVHGPWTTKARVTTCFRALVGGNAQVVEVADEDGMTRFTAGREAMYVAWPQPGVLLLPLGQMEEAGRLRTLLTPSDTSGAAITPLLAEVRRDATVWGAFLTDNDPDLAATFEGMGASTPPVGIYVEARVGRELKARVGLRFRDTDSAARVAEGVRDQLAELGRTAEGNALAPFLEHVQVKTTGTDVVIWVNLPEDQLEALGNLVAGSL